MRVCLIGTSNALYAEGYAAGIAAHPLVTRFKKFAVGASPSVIIPYFGVEVDFAEWDWVILETTINDRNYLKYDSIRKDQIRQFVEWGIARASAAGCRAALLAMPTIPGLHREATPRLIYRKIAAEQGLIYFDGFKFLADASKAQNCGVLDLFIDPFHILKPVARGLGYSLMETIVAAGATPLPSFPLRSHFYRRDLAAFDDSRAVSRESSIMTARFLRLEDARPVELQVGPRDELVGISYNAAKTTGAVRLGGAVKSLSTKYVSERPLMLLVAPVTSNSAKADSHGNFRLQLANPNEPTSETSRFEHMTKTEHGHWLVEIEALIFRRRLR